MRSCILICLIFFFINISEGCHYYREDGGMEGDGDDMMMMDNMGQRTGRRRKKRNIAYNPSDTSYLRRYFAACMEWMVPDQEYDWRSNVDFTVLDSLWHLNTLQIYCSPGVNGPSFECWQKEITNYLRSNSKRILNAAQQCISHYAEDIGQSPPANRYRNMASSIRRKRAVRVRYNNSTNMFGLDRLPMYDKCLTATTPNNGDRGRLVFDKLTFFINENTETLCDSSIASQALVRPSWPYRFVALTRPDTVIRQPLEECAVEVFPPDPFWSVWGGWSSCSSTCGNGMQQRRRTCRDGEDPRRESQGCVGMNKETKKCQIKPCPDPTPFYSWGRWSQYTRCSRSCGGGYTFRSRPCRKNNRKDVRVTFCIRFSRSRTRQFKYCNRFPCKHYK